MPKQIVRTSEAPDPIGPYSQAVRAGHFLFVSGQTPLDPKTGTLVSGDIQAQARRIMQNLEAILKEAGASFAHVVKTTIYLVDLADFERVNEIYGSYVPHDPPARTTVQVSALPRRALIEIDVVAYLGA